MSLFIVLLQIFRVVVIQPCEFKTRHLRKQQGNLQFCYNFSSVLSQVKGLPVAKSHKKILFFKCSSTPERKVPQRSDASQNDHKSKGYPSKKSSSAAALVYISIQINWPYREHQQKARNMAQFPNVFANYTNDCQNDGRDQNTFLRRRIKPFHLPRAFALSSF